MARVICPDFFGCSGKLSYRETRYLASMGGSKSAEGDFSSLTTEGTIVSSIDRVHRCAKDWDQFARIALNHAFGDVVCAGATPVQAMLSFEFGIDALEGEIAICSKAFSRELEIRGVALGKCHSCRTEGVTAVTITTLGANPTRIQPKLEIGKIYLSRPIGALKAQYLTEMGAKIDDPSILSFLERPADEQFQSVRWDFVTDVSGHGMLGAVAQISHMRDLEIHLDLDPSHAIIPEVLSRTVECLQNPLDSYDLSLGNVNPSAAILITLRETAGPFLGFIEDASDEKRVGLGMLVGRYRRGNTKVHVSWAA